MGGLTKNSVVLGTRAKRVIPRNFSSMSTLSSTTSTVFTRISAMMAYKRVAPSRITALFVLLQFGASCPPEGGCGCSSASSGKPGGPGCLAVAGRVAGAESNGFTGFVASRAATVAAVAATSVTRRTSMSLCSSEKPGNFKLSGERSLPLGGTTWGVGSEDDWCCSHSSSPLEPARPTCFKDCLRIRAYKGESRMEPFKLLPGAAARPFTGVFPTGSW